MRIFNNPIDDKKTTKPKMEMVEQEKDEYKLISKYLRTKGLMLFSYNSFKDELKIIKIDKKKDVELKIKNGKFVKEELSDEECVVDSRNTHFESLNKKSALKRVKNYKEGKIKELNNLRLPNIESIKLW